MGSKSNDLNVWDRLNPKSVNIRYSDEAVFLEPRDILENEVAEEDTADILETRGLEANENKEARHRPASLSIRELRRRFWHLRNRGKKMLRRKRIERDHPKEPVVNNKTTQRETHPKPDPSELFDPSLGRVRLGSDIEALSDKVEGKTASEAELFQLLQCYYKAGHLTEAERLIRENEEVLLSEEVADPTLANKVLHDLHMLEQPPTVPDRGAGPVVLPEKGRILYCAASTTHYHSNGYATRTFGLVSGLKNQGKDVVVAARPGYPWDVKTHRDYTKSIFHVKYTEGVEYAYSYGPSLRSQSLSQYLKHAVDSYLRLIEKYRPAHIHAASNHVTALPALIAARISGLPFTYEVRGFWEYALQDTLAVPNERRVLATKLEDIVLANSDHIFILSKEMKTELELRGYSPSDITVLPNGVDTEVFQPLPKVGDLVNKHNLDDGKVNIGYAGSMVAYEGLDLLTEALLEISEERDDFRLVLVGDGPVLPAVKQKLAESSSSIDVKILGRIDPHNMPSIMASIDVTVAARKSTEVTRLVSPLKPLESMAAGVPFIASDLPVLRDLVQESGGGVLFEAMNSHSLAEEIESFLDAPSELKVRGRIGREWTIRNRRWDNLAGRLIAGIENLPALDIKGSRKLSDIQMGIIADEFTTTSFHGVVNHLEINREDWQNQLNSSRIDLLFVESAWQGNGGQWRRGIGHYSEEESKDLRDLIDFCNRNQIPTVFWNKEDPVHFERFKTNAMLFDMVLTTDNRSIGRYQDLQQKAHQQFGSMPFYATPRIHHPVVEYSQQSSQIIYAGSYYGDRYPERSENLLALLEAAKSFGLSIFDRQLDNPDSPYKFPESLQPYVRGGLQYSEMLEAYRKFPIHLNVNSVSRSETMFSRRVVEIGLTGGMVLSSPSVAMSMLFSGMVPQVSHISDAKAMLSLATSSPELRNLHGWNLRRLIRRSHTVYTRLSTIIRRLGINVEAGPRPILGAKIQPEVQIDDLQSLLDQTYLPTYLVVERVDEVDAEKQDILFANGIEVVTEGQCKKDSLCDYIFHWDGNFLDPETLEDMVYLAEDTSAIVVYLNTSRPTKISVPLASIATQGFQTESYLEYKGVVQQRSEIITLHRGMVDSSTSRTVTQLECHRENPTIRREILLEEIRGKTVLVAGHDLKFVSPFIDELKSSGVTVLTDKWDSHNSHDEEGSLELLDSADVILCEWGLGNAVWYSNHVREGQRLVVRVHSQELFRNYLRRLNTHKVDELIFVAPHILDAAHSISRLRGVPKRVVPNIVRRGETSFQELQANRRFVIGLVGVVPQQKGLDRALDLLEILRTRDSRFSLRVKGKLPSDYPWMLARDEEMAFYNQQYDRIQSNPLLKDAVLFDGFSTEWDEMKSWYNSVGIAVSLSDFESFHFTLVDGPLNGALPLSLRWPGSDRLYPEHWLSNDIGEMANSITDVVSDAEDWVKKTQNAREFVLREFGPESAILELFASLADD